MEVKCVKLLMFNIFVAVNIRSSLQCPFEDEDQKAAYKSGEIVDQELPVTLTTIKKKLKDSGVIDVSDPGLTDREKKELSKLFDAVEIMLTSRARQPQNAQNLFGSLRIVERAMKKQFKEGQISESLAEKFKWENVNNTKNKNSPPQAPLSEAIQIEQ